MFLGRKRSVPTVSAWSDPKEHRKGILSVFLIHHFHRGKKEKLTTTLFLFRILERFMGQKYRLIPQLKSLSLFVRQNPVRELEAQQFQYRFHLTWILD